MNRVMTLAYHMTLLSYCVRYESAAFVRLLLSHGADTEQRGLFPWRCIDYALMRQDKAIREALDEVVYTADWNRDTEPADNALQSLLLPSNAVLASPAHAPLALMLARRDKEKSREAA